MIFNRINLEQELIRERQRQHKILGDVYDILAKAVERDGEVLKRLQSAPEVKASGVTISIEDLPHVFETAEIRKICVRYRLRFLDTVHFKSASPAEAIAKINRFEKKYGVEIRNFKIMAPDHAFNLENVNRDPVLFASLDNDTYFLLHKWGKDMAWYKKFLVWPFQNMRTFFISLWLVALILTCIIPSSVMHVFTPESEFYLRAWLVVHMFIGLSGLSLGAAFSFDKTFSVISWDSKFRNF